MKKTGKIIAITSAAASVLGAGFCLFKKVKEYKSTMSQAQSDMPDNVAPADPKYRDRTKRMLDIMICAPALVFASIPMAIAAIAVKLDSPGPVLFRQKRLGLNGEEFEMLKFRSMCVGAEHTGSGVYSGDGDSRVTRVGKIIRATSIDELPQLINILRGDMSLIGPRPPLTYHPWPIEDYTEEQRRMFEVRPGVTGWAQTHGRKDVEWHHRIELNVWYVDHVSLALDMRIFFSTIFKVLINADNKNIEATLQTAEESVETEAAMDESITESVENADEKDVETEAGVIADEADVATEAAEITDEAELAADVEE